MAIAGYGLWFRILGEKTMSSSPLDRLQTIHPLSNSSLIRIARSRRGNPIQRSLRAMWGLITGSKSRQGSGRHTRPHAAPGDDGRSSGTGRP